MKEIIYHTLIEALQIIKSNNSQSFVWVWVKNYKGSIIQVGGNNFEKLEVKAYISSYDGGELEYHSSGIIKSAYSIDNNGIIKFPTYTISHNMSYYRFLLFLNSTDFSKYDLKIKTKYVAEYRPVYSLLTFS